MTASTQYGPRITAIVLYLYVGQFLSKKRTAQALAELFGTPVSEGTVAAVTRRAADGLDEFLDVVRDRIAEADVAGFDETGLRVAGDLHWVHCARTDKHTLITCHRGRGQDGIDDAGVLTRFRGVAVHDAWAPYDTYVNADHQLCCAHALRELQAVADTAAHTDPDAQWCWATQAADALVAMQKLVDDAIMASADAIGSVREYRPRFSVGTDRVGELVPGTAVGSGIMDELGQEAFVLVYEAGDQPFTTGRPVTWSSRPRSRSGRRRAAARRGRPATRGRIATVDRACGSACSTWSPLCGIR